MVAKGKNEVGGERAKQEVAGVLGERGNERERGRESEKGLTAKTKWSIN